MPIPNLPPPSNTVMVHVGTELVERQIDHYDEHVWRGLTEHKVERIAIPVVLPGERLKRVPGGFRILRKGEF
jgi:hypothetical protein